jgi:hypothetical protein
MKLSLSALTFAVTIMTVVAVLHAQTQEAPMSHATGPFEVKITPQDDKLGDGISRMLLDKQFHGDLEGASKGQMLASGSAKSSGAYVALETFTGSLHGKSGSFALHHTGVMTKGTPTLMITVVPDSGTGQLAGIAGKMTINIAADGKHSYDFEYTLPEKN